MLRVGVDAWNLPHDRRGIGRYVRSILRSWREHAADRVRVTLIAPEWHTWTVAQTYRRAAGSATYAVVSRALHDRAALDVLWFPWNGCSWTSFHKPAVATLHDACSFDLPEKAAEGRRDFHAAAAHCAHLITDSTYSQRRLSAALNVPADSFDVIPLGVALPLAANDALSPDVTALKPYVLFVGTTDPHKGLDTLMQAMRAVKQRYPELRCVVAGMHDDTALREREPACTMLGYVNDARLAELYRGAEMFVFPSRYEGFGLPVLEAMAYGTPVISSDATSLPEAGGDAALYVPVDDANALADAIVRMHEDNALRARLSRDGFERARAMSWARTAEATLATLSHAATAPRPPRR